MVSSDAGTSLASARREPALVTPAGNSPAIWSETLARAPELRPADLSALPSRWTQSTHPAGRLVVVSAHPDDETIGAGRLIAEWARTIGHVASVVVTAGEACVAHLGIEVPGLGARRLAEWRAAMIELGAEPLQFCGLPDGDVAAHEDVLAETLGHVLQPGDVVLAPWRHDPHPDHAAAGRAASTATRRAGANLLEYPVWMTFWTDPEILERTSFRVVRVASTSAADLARDRALGSFHSQNEPLRPDLTPVVPASMLEHHPRQLALLPTRAHRD